MFGSVKKSGRLVGWDGRRHSSRSEPIWPHLLHKRALGRLAVVLAAAVAVTAIAYFGGPPFPYRVGEVLAHDVRVRVDFDIVNHPLTDRQREQAEGRPAPPPVVERYAAGTPLVKRGTPVTQAQLVLIAEENRAYRRSLVFLDHARRAAALFLIVGLLAALVALYVRRHQPQLAGSPSKIRNVCVLTVVTLGLALTLARAPWYASLVPLTATALILTIAYNPPFALLMSLSLAIVTTLAQGADFCCLLVQMGGMAAAVLLLGTARTRAKIVEVAVAAGVAFALMTVATGLLTGQTPKFMAGDAVRYVLWSTLAGFILSGSLPVVERWFGVITDVTLLELADSSHPLMQELIRRAPGTYTHSVTVATLAEAAAEAIGAHSLLVRVGSYYHDIGKMLKPHYFIENQSGENRHDALEPALSTLVIIGHVKDGVALAEQYQLPKPIVHFIQQHHGTTLVEYFYREALRLQEANGHGSGELEFAFRYPGPKPQTREIGILMLADCVESASRALSAPTPNSLRKMVHDLLMKRLLDGQFDDSGLTLTELHRVEESLCKGLIALYHARIKYPAEPPVKEAS